MNKKYLEDEMRDAERRGFDKMFFNYETVTKECFQPHKLTRAPPRVRVKKPEQVFERKYAPKYLECMYEWNKGTPAPFTLFIRPNPILGTDPRVPQKPPEAKIVDEGREQAQKTRPRMAVSPAVNLDDIEDQDTRDIIIQDVYQSEISKAQKFAAERAFPLQRNIKALLGETFAPPRPLLLPNLKFPYVSTEWRMQTLDWDRKQQRGEVKPTEEFWKDFRKQRAMERKD